MGVSGLSSNGDVSELHIVQISGVDGKLGLSSRVMHGKTTASAMDMVKNRFLIAFIIMLSSIN